MSSELQHNLLFGKTISPFIDNVHLMSLNIFKFSKNNITTVIIALS